MTERKELTSPEDFHAALQGIKEQVSIAPEPINEQNKTETEHEVSTDTAAPIEERESPATEEAEELVEPVKDVPIEASDSDSEDDYKSRKFIPKSRFNQEIEKRKEIENKWMQEREEKIRLEERLSAFTQRNSPETNSFEQELTLDAIDALDTETHKVYSREINNLKNELKRTSEQTKNMQYSNIINNQENIFVAENPDYMKAAAYLKEVEVMGAKEMFGDERAANQVVAQKYQQIMTNAIEAGKSVPETIYKLAKTYGYKPQSDAVDASKTPSNHGSNLKAINSNMKKSASISSLGNGAGMGGVGSNWDSARVDPKDPRSPFDPKKFHEKLNNLRYSNG